MTASKAVAFLSYAHADDEPPQRPVTKFREELTKALRRYLGEDDIDIFQDNVSISWGERWRERIGDSLNEIQFFIPIMSPRYFASEPCRAEAEAFLTRAERVGRPDLLLPVYFVDYSMHRSRASDDLVHAFEDHQYVDWREYRLSNNSTARRRAFDRLGQRIASAILRPDRESITTPRDEPQPLEISHPTSIEEADRDDTVAIGQGSLMPGESDVFEVLLSADDSYVVYVEPADDSVDFDLIVRDQDGDVVEHDTGEEAIAWCQFTPAASGFFTLQVTAFRGASDYQVIVASASSLVEDGGEGDGGEIVFSGAIADGDEQAIDIDLAGGVRHEIWLIPDNTTLDIDLAVYDEHGQLVATDAAEAGVCEFTTARTETFRLIISATRGAGGYTIMMREHR
jgi:hypothetical protein